MSNKKSKTVGEGGTHKHRLSNDARQTEIDGIHKHLYFINERLLMTDLDGVHSHSVNSAEGEIGPENEKHQHMVSVRTVEGLIEFPTISSSGHIHELQTASTTLSGVHTHILEISNQLHISIVPGDLIEEARKAAKKDTSFDGLKLKCDETYPLELDYNLVKQLNQFSYQSLLEQAVVTVQLKRLTSLSEGLQIESLILSRERFNDVGTATRFVLDNGLDIQSSRVLESEGIYTFQVMDSSKFSQASLQRIRITEGVEAVIGFLTEDGPVDFADDINEDELEKSVDSSLVNWSTDKAIEGSFQEMLIELREKFDIQRKFVAVEYPQRKYLKYIEENYEIINAAYDDISSEQYKSYKSLQAKGDDIEIFVVTIKNTTDLIIFFDNEDDIKKILTTKKKNYEPGTYTIQETMCGYALVPVNVAHAAKPIMDESILEKLEEDTEYFFSNEQFYKDNPELDFNRGIFFIGSPGNGKTMFIKYYFKKSKSAKRFNIMIDCTQNFSSCILSYLKSVTNDEDEKVIVFEDMDAIAENPRERAAMLNFIDGVEAMTKTLFIATSNHPGKLDEAILDRPSRFDRKYMINSPNFELRKQFLLKFFPELNETELAEYSKKTEGFSGAYFKEMYILMNISKGATIEKVIEDLQEQKNMIFKKVKSTKKSMVDSIEYLCFENYIEKKGKQIDMKSLREKFAKLKDTKKEKKKTSKRKNEINKAIERAIFKGKHNNIIKTDEDKRLVMGPVLIPENIDLQDDIISSKEIEQAAHNYMVKLAFQNDMEFLEELGLTTKSERGFMHIEFSRKLAVVESYISPIDFELNGRLITKGTWIMTMKVFDDEAWAMIKTGKITGFSIGGRARTTSEMIED